MTDNFQEQCKGVLIVGKVPIVCIVRLTESPKTDSVCECPSEMLSQDLARFGVFTEIKVGYALLMPFDRQGPTQEEQQ
jgi:hypothetical protein